MTVALVPLLVTLAMQPPAVPCGPWGPSDSSGVMVPPCLPLAVEDTRTPAPVVTWPSAEVSTRHATHIGITIGVVLGTADIARTAYEIGAKRAYERNPLLAPVSDRPELFAVVKSSADAAVVWYLLSQREKHPKTTLVAAWLWVGMRAAIVWHNYRTVVAARGR
mgnify:FL=1